MIFVVVDRLTKFVHFGPLPTSFTAASAATLFVDMVVKIHGFSTTNISDRDPIFMSNFWQSLFKLSGTQLRHSTTYHPQTHGQSEVFSQGLEQYLQAFTLSKVSRWASFLGWEDFSHNTSYCSNVRMTSFEALFGRLPLMIPMYVKGKSKIQSLDELLQERDALLHQLKDNLLSTQQRMRQKTNSHRRELELKVGDSVQVRLQPYLQSPI